MLCKKKKSQNGGLQFVFNAFWKMISQARLLSLSLQERPSLLEVNLKGTFLLLFETSNKTCLQILFSYATCFCVSKKKSGYC